MREAAVASAAAAYSQASSSLQNGMRQHGGHGHFLAADGTIMTEGSLRRWDVCRGQRQVWSYLGC